MHRTLRNVRYGFEPSYTSVWFLLVVLALITLGVAWGGLSYRNTEHTSYGQQISYKDMGYEFSK